MMSVSSATPTARRATVIEPRGVRWLTSCVALGLSILTCSATASPQIEHWTTASETRVYFTRTTQIPMVDLVVQFDAGSSRDGKQSGLADLTARMLNTGADGMSLEAIALAFSELGALFSAQTDNDATVLSLRSLSDADTVDQALALFIRVLSKPDFPAQHFNRLKKARLASLVARDQNIGSIAQRHFANLVYGGHPYGRWETRETIDALTVDDIKRFHKRYYARNNMSVVIVGDVSLEQARAMVDRIEQSLDVVAPAPPLPPVQPLKRAVKKAIAHPSQQVHVFIGQPLIKVGHPDFHALYLGNHILGGGGFGSRLTEEIRVKRGLAYDSHSTFRTRREAGPFYLTFQTRDDQKDLAISVARNVLQDFIQNGPSDDELELSRTAILGSSPFRFASNAAIKGAISRLAHFNLPPNYLAQFDQRIRSLTREEVVAAFRRHINPDALATVAVGGAEAN